MHTDAARQFHGDKYPQLEGKSACDRDETGKPALPRALWFK